MFRISIALLILVGAATMVVAPEAVVAQSGVENFFDLGRLPYLKDSKLVQISSYDTTGGNADRLVIPIGETAVLADIAGAGVVTRIWITISSRDPYFLRRILLRMYWDGEKHPSVECPVGDFFGTGFEYTHYTSLLLGMSSGGYYSYIPMPFSDGARIEVENGTAQDINAFYYHIDYQKMERIEKNVGRFHAQWRREAQTKPGVNYTLLEAEGYGHFFGCNMSMQGRTGNITFLEGDEMIYVDGEAFPSIYGTGTEDYFTSGWYFNKGTYAGLLHGCIIKDTENNRVAAYRFHLGDAVPFRESIRVTIEHGHANEVAADYSSVAYWYQKEPHRPFEPILPPNARVPLRLVVPTGALEAEDLKVEFRGKTPVSEATFIEDMSAFGAEWSNDRQLTCKAKTLHDRLTLHFPVEVGDIYDVRCYMTKGPEYGQVSLSIPSHLATTDFNGYAEEVSHGGFVEIGEVGLVRGEHELHLEVSGKDRSASGYQVGVDCIVLSPHREFIRDWFLIGPFDNAKVGDNYEGLGEVYPPEKEIKLDGVYAGKNGKEVSWTRFQAGPDGHVNLNELLMPNDYTIAYGLTYVYSPREVSVPVYLGSDDGVRLWLNDKLVHDHPVWRGAIPDNDRVDVVLHSGWNKLLVKVEEVLGEWGFYVRIPDVQRELAFSPERKK